jgi:DNA-binding LacI/PurR family transcriptional regulator
MSTAVRRPTIRDVAAKAGVSKSLVSLVYSSPGEVSEHRRELVLEAAAELGFSPNFLARSLAAESGTFIGILVADLHNPLFAEIVDHVRAELEVRGQYGFMTSAMLTNADGTQVIDRRTVSALVDLRPKSVLVVGSIPTVHGLAALPENINIVVAGAIADGLPRATTVHSDDTKGITLAVEHLIAQGHKRIAFINVQRGEIAKTRRSGYLTAMDAHGLGQCTAIEVLKSDSEVESYERAVKLLQGKNPPTAIVCYNDLVALGAQEAINEYVAQGGPRVALTGYDNTYLAALKQISLTSVDHGTAEIGKKAAEILCQKSAPSAKRGKTFLLEPTLAIRNSSNFKVSDNHKGA